MVEKRVQKGSRVLREGGRRQSKRMDASTPRDEKGGLRDEIWPEAAAPVGKRKVIEKGRRFLPNFYLIFNKYSNKFQRLQILGFASFN
jgi:hypothetical protein